MNNSCIPYPIWISVNDVSNIERDKFARIEDRWYSNFPFSRGFILFVEVEREEKVRLVLYRVRDYQGKFLDKIYFLFLCHLQWSYHWHHYHSRFSAFSNLKFLHLITGPDPREFWTIPKPKKSNLTSDPSSFTIFTIVSYVPRTPRLTINNDLTTES